jgi:hypothetical protein
MDIHNLADIHIYNLQFQNHVQGSEHTATLNQDFISQALQKLWILLFELKQPEHGLLSLTITS